MRPMIFPNALECFETRLELEASSVDLFFFSFVAKVSRVVFGFVDIATWDLTLLSAEGSLSLSKWRVLSSKPNEVGESSFDTTDDTSTIEADCKGSSTSTVISTSSSERSVH
jgi:hypothetical protein